MGNSGYKSLTEQRGERTKLNSLYCFQSFEHEELKLKSLNGQSVYAYEFYSLLNPENTRAEEETQSFSEIQRTASKFHFFFLKYHLS